MHKVLITGWAGFSGSQLIGNLYFELMRHDGTFPLYVEVDRILTLPAPALPIITSMTRCRPPRPVYRVKLTCLGWPSG